MEVLYSPLGWLVVFWDYVFWDYVFRDYVFRLQCVNLLVRVIRNSCGSRKEYDLQDHRNHHNETDKEQIVCINEIANQYTKKLHTNLFRLF